METKQPMPTKEAYYAAAKRIREGNALEGDDQIVAITRAPTASYGPEQVRDFGNDRSAAWAFMREIDEAGGKAGYPSLKAPYTVRYIPRKG